MRKNILVLFLVVVGLFAVPAYADQFDSIVLSAPGGTNTGTGATASVAVSNANLRIAKQALFILTDASLAGTSPTLDVKLQASYDGTNWADVPSGAFTQMTASGSTALRLNGPFGYKLRYHITNGGTAVTASAPTVKAVIQY